MTPRFTHLVEKIAQPVEGDLGYSTLNSILRAEHESVGYRVPLMIVGSCKVMRDIWDSMMENT